MRRKIKVKPRGTSRDKSPDPLVDLPVVERVRTPGWLLERFPELKRTIPKCIVDRVRNNLKGLLRGGRIPGDLQKTAIGISMNNFSYTIYVLLSLSPESLRLKPPPSGGQYHNSTKYLNATHGEFLEEIQRAIKECGLSFEKVKELISNPRVSGGFTNSNYYLFPAFVRLIEIGYNPYPDLTA